MEADKTQNLLSELANWRLKKANGIVLVIRPAGFSSSSKAGKKTVFQFKGSQEEFSLTWGSIRHFVLFRPSTD